MVRGRRNINVKDRIKDALEEKPLVWSELEEKSKVSKGALSKHLNTLIKFGIVLTKTRDTRPPVTEYYLASDEKLKIISYLLRNLPEKQAMFFVENFNENRIFEVVSEALAKLMEDYAKRIRERRRFSKEFDLKPILKSIGISNNFLAAHKDRKLSYRVGIPKDYFQVDLNNEDEINNAIIKEVFSEVSIQLFLSIYDLERKFFDSIPFQDEIREKIIHEGKLEGFTILSLIQKNNIWSEIEALFNWWKKNVMQHVPSVIFITLLANDMFNLKRTHL